MSYCWAKYSLHKSTLKIQNGNEHWSFGSDNQNQIISRILNHNIAVQWVSSLGIYGLNCKRLFRFLTITIDPCAVSEWVSVFSSKTQFQILFWQRYRTDPLGPELFKWSMHATHLSNWILHLKSNKNSKMKLRFIIVYVILENSNNSKESYDLSHYKVQCKDKPFGKMLWCIV